MIVHWIKSAVETGMQCEAIEAEAAAGRFTGIGSNRRIGPVEERLSSRPPITAHCVSFEKLTLHVYAMPRDSRTARGQPCHLQRMLPNGLS